jgi:hypothetical protein
MIEIILLLKSIIQFIISGYLLIFYRNSKFNSQSKQ